MKKTLYTFESACESCGYDAATILPVVSHQPEWLQKYTIAQTKRLIIAEAIKKGKHPKPGQRRYFPVFNSLCGFVCSNAYFTHTNTYLGARLDFNTETESDEFGENYNDLHRAVMVIED